MKRTIEISASFTGTISTGSYENMKPYFSVKEIIELPDTEEAITLFGNDTIQMRQKELHGICYDQFKRQEQVAYAEKIAKDYKDIRFYDGKDGAKYPSVTSITGMDKDFHISPEELAQYGARGTCIHKQVEKYLLEGVWSDIKDIAEVSHEYMTVVQGSLGLALDDTGFQGFYKDYPFKVVELEKEVINSEHKYGGRLDILCIIESENKGKWEKVEGVVYDSPTILDIKTSTSLDKTSGLTQQAAYAKAEEVGQIGLIHLTKDNKCGFAKPVITTNVPRYWDLFIKKRKLFHDRYGV